MKHPFRDVSQVVRCDCFQGIDILFTFFHFFFEINYFFFKDRALSVAINDAGSAVGIAVDVGIAVASHAVAAIVVTDRVDFSIVVVGFAIGSRFLLS